MQASEAERKLRRAVGEVVADHQTCAATRSTDCKSVLRAIKRLEDKGPLHIVDFNFDSTLLGLLGQPGNPIGDTPTVPRLRSPGGGSVLRADDLRALYWRTRLWNNRNVWLWKPHGHCGRPTTIRMGLRDYGLQPALVEYAFSQYKQAEKGRRAAIRRDMQQHIAKQVAAMDEGKPVKLCDNWITRVMCFECHIIGLSLSHHEWGLQWLFAQRVRNYVSKGQPPTVKHFVVEKQELVLGVQRVPSCSWDSAWRRLGQ